MADHPDNTTAQAERTVTAKGVPLIRMVYARHTTDGHSTQIVGVTEDVARSLHRVLGQVLGTTETAVVDALLVAFAVYAGIKDQYSLTEDERAQINRAIALTEERYKGKS